MTLLPPTPALLVPTQPAGTGEGLQGERRRPSDGMPVALVWSVLGRCGERVSSQKKQDTHLRNRRASQQVEVSRGKGGSKRWGCSGGELVGGQEAPRPLGRGTSNGALAAHIKKQTWASVCRAAPCQCHPPGSPPGPESTWPQHRHVPCSGAATLTPAHPVSKVVLVLYLSRRVEQAISWSMHLFSFLFSMSVFF